MDVPGGVPLMPRWHAYKDVVMRHSDGRPGWRSSDTVVRHFGAKAEADIWRNLSTNPECSGSPLREDDHILAFFHDLSQVTISHLLASFHHAPTL